MKTIMKYKVILIMLMVFVMGAACRVEKQKPQKETFGPGDYDFTLKHDGKKRKFRVHLPPDYQHKGTKMAVVIFFHGGGGNIRSAYVDGLDKESDKYGFILAIPAATRVKFGPMSSRWNGGKWKGGKCCGKADDVGFISKMIDEIITKFNADKNRIYATGISNGGLMANRVACELADKIAAVAVVAPAAVPQNCQPSRPIPVMDIHGTGDLCNPFDGSLPRGVCGKVDYKRMSPHEVVDTWLDLNQCSAKSKIVFQNATVTCESFKCKAKSEVVFCKVEGMGHTWPSGAQYVSARIVGPVSYDISTKVIADFFRRHTLK